jgi:hypothetical protein
VGTMVDEPAVIELKSRWFPTKFSVERSWLMGVEFSANSRPAGNRPSMVEAVWTSGSIEQVMSSLPSIVPSKTRKLLRQVLEPWPNGRLTAAYGRSGGILNLFTPPWGESQDEVWATMRAGWEAESFPDAETRNIALQKLEWQWNSTPHPFFAGLTPEQVMVGGGPQEADLAEEFLVRLTKVYENQHFASEGEVLMKTLMLLRGWSCQPQSGGLTPVRIIVAERRALLARRRHLLTKEITS